MNQDVNTERQNFTLGLHATDVFKTGPKTKGSKKILALLQREKKQIMLLYK